MTITKTTKFTAKKRAELYELEPVKEKHSKAGWIVLGVVFVLIIGLFST